MSFIDMERQIPLSTCTPAAPTEKREATAERKKREKNRTLQKPAGGSSISRVTGRPVQVLRTDQWDGRKGLLKECARCGACPKVSRSKSFFFEDARMLGEKRFVRGVAATVCRISTVFLL
ncbi:hypothetical protein CEXT_484781 [Caerostris extrusa]|uniref:Uncharacterized protein n=1 Tax=Caerostris extrusa TaxID=172846 RepID=A0AAV4Y310_CAEEX|nr:hypothetical protein CEXT_484781 [Caerostris extrusa]